MSTWSGATGRRNGPDRARPRRSRRHRRVPRRPRRGRRSRPTGSPGPRGSALAERLLTPGRAWPVVAISVATGHDAPTSTSTTCSTRSRVSRRWSSCRPARPRGRSPRSCRPGRRSTVARRASTPSTTSGSRRPAGASCGSPTRTPTRGACSTTWCTTASRPPSAPACSAPPRPGRAARRGNGPLDPRSPRDRRARRRLAREHRRGAHRPGVLLARLLVVGQRVAGTLDRESHRLDVRTSLRPPDGATHPGGDACLGGYAVGQVVLADVTAVAHATVRLRLVPGLEVLVSRGYVTGNPIDALDDLFTVGEVVLARVVSTSPWTLRLDDVDDAEEEPVLAPSLLAGGPPWLVLPEVAHARQRRLRCR
ncbi:hypothetical protein NKG05_10700 [Oerskovia sp. M15]